MEFKTLSHLNRAKEIVGILFKYGFDDLVRRIDLPGGGAVQKMTQIDPGMGTFERIRHAMEELGPTFVKFGQIMSLRPDMLPPSLVQELSRLQDNVPPMEFTAAESVVQKSYGRPLKEIFSVFDRTPLAAASLSQVHRGVLRQEGVIVAVKVQRPAIREKLVTDLDILEWLVSRLQTQFEDLGPYRLPELIKTTRRNLIKELDFNREARLTKIARSRLSKDPGVYIPDVFESYCTEHVLVMEFVQGQRLHEIKIASISDSTKIARNGLRSAIHQILSEGFFHADPHPGNVLINEKSQVCLLDWGMTGRLTLQDRKELIELLRSLIEKDAEAAVETLLRVSRSDRWIDKRSLEREILDVIDYYYALPLKKLNIGRLLMDISVMMRDFGLQLPPDFVIMTKALVTAEGSARLIYPDLNVVAEAKESIERLASNRYSVGSLKDEVFSGLAQFFKLYTHFPEHIFRLIHKLDKGEIGIRFEHQNLDGLRRTLHSTFNRLTFGVIMAAIIIGSSMIVTTGVGPLLFGFPALGIIGYSISVVLGFWLVFQIIRQRRY